LFVRAREDPARFGDVYLAYRDQVLRFFARRTLDPEVAFDLMAETFAEMFSGLSGFDGQTEAQGRAWMWSIAKHELIDFRQTGEVERRNLERLALPVPSLGAEEYERIEELADLDRRKPEVLKALDKLPETQRFVIYEHFIKGREYDAIAQQLGTTAVSLRMRASRGLRQLGHLLAAELEDDETPQELVR
jgi:RNA polymerase sigma-70 factor (ECF subfamily)